MSESHDFFSYVSRGEFINALRCVPFDVAARSLAQQCRYNGTATRFYSVAQHSVLISKQWPDGDPRAVWGLLHDLHECVIGDIARPVRDKLLWVVGREKRSSDYIEGRLLREVQKRFGLDPIPDDVLKADRLIVADEMSQLFDRPRVPVPPVSRAECLGVTIKPANPTAAEWLFVQRARVLGVDKLFELQPRK